MDRGADISPLSYYPEEREKLYGALSMMQVRCQMSLAWRVRSYALP